MTLNKTQSQFDTSNNKSSMNSIGESSKQHKIFQAVMQHKSTSVNKQVNCYTATSLKICAWREQLSPPWWWLFCQKRLDFNSLDIFIELLAFSYNFINVSYCFDRTRLFQIYSIINPRRHKPKNVTRRQKDGRVGWSIRPLPSTFNTIHSIDLIFGKYNELSLYFHLIETLWCLVGFHGKPQPYKWRHQRSPSWIFKFSDFYYIQIEHWKWWENNI